MESRPWVRWVIALCLLTGFHALYLMSLSDNERVFGSTFNTLFVADTGAFALATQRPGFGDVGPEKLIGTPFFTTKASMNEIRSKFTTTVQARKARKHLLYSHTSNALYRMFRSALRVMRSEWSVALERLCLVFPSALMGSLAVLLFFFSAHKYTGNLLLSSLFAVLLGASFGTWFYSSIPESTAAQALCTVAFAYILLFSRTIGWRVVLLLSLVTCVGILQGINCVLLVPVGGLYLLLRRQFVQALVYGVLTTCVILGVYSAVASATGSPVGILDTAEFASASIDRYAGQEYAVFSAPLLQKPLYTFLRFALVGVAAMPLPPEEYNTLDAVRSYFDSPLSGVFIVVYGLLIFLAVRGIFRQVAGNRDTTHKVIALLSWLMLVLCFYAYFDAYESLLYSAHFLIPLWTLYLLGFKQCLSEPKPMRRLYLGVGLLCAALLLANNLTYVFVSLPNA
jgi:hypothetical protein